MKLSRSPSIQTIQERFRIKTWERDDIEKTPKPSNYFMDTEDEYEDVSEARYTRKVKDEEDSELETKDKSEDESEDKDDKKGKYRDKYEKIFHSGNPKRILWGESNDYTSIIIEPGATCNLIGHQLIPILKQRLAQGGVKLETIPSKIKIKMGEENIVESFGKIMVPLILGKTKLDAEIHIINTEAPFLIGGQFLRQQKVDVSYT